MGRKLEGVMALRWLIVGALMAGACGGPAIRRVELAPDELGDSLVLERTPGWAGNADAWRLRLRPDGHVHFVRQSPPDSGRTAEARVEPEAVEDLIERAAGLRLDSIPSPLMGRPPYCSPADRDSASAIITWFRSTTQQQVRDYLGCLEENDRSDEQVILRLREFERAIERVAGVERWIVGIGTSETQARSVRE